MRAEPSETLKAVKKEYRALRRSGLSHKRAAAIIEAALAKAIPAAVNVVMAEIKEKGLAYDEFSEMAAAGWFDDDEVNREGLCAFCGGCSFQYDQTGRGVCVICREPVCR